MNSNDAASERLRDRFAGALMGTFAGDALGMPVENWSAEKIESTFGRLDHFRTAALWLRGYAAVYGSLYDPVRTFGRAPLARGTYTDDTQMMIAVAESLIDRNGFDGADMARRFVESFDPRRGYGPGTIKALKALRGGTPWESVGKALFNGTGSFGNGAAMRTAPLALLHHDDLDALRRDTTRAASITHAHALGIEGAVIQATAIQIALGLGVDQKDIEPIAFLDALRERAAPLGDVFAAKLDSVQLLLESEPPVREIVARLGNNTSAQGSVPAALYAFLRKCGDFKEAVVYAVSLGGDTDTIGAMAGAVAGAYHGAGAIPRDWLEAMEDGEKGRSYVASLAERLFELTGR
jgi:poly(ADP-ribose) glycohydrolase ARH3